MHGTVYANNAVNEADLLLAIGVRFDDRVTGKIEKFCKHGTIVHIDIDNSEINKNKLVKLPILSDVKYALEPRERILEKMGRTRRSKGYTRFPQWYQQIARWKEKHPLRFQGHRRRDPAAVRHRMPLRVDQGRGDHHHGRGPAPDVGRPVL